MGELVVYRSGFGGFQGPFWSLLEQTLQHDAGHVTILVPHAKDKSWLLSYLKKRLPQNQLLPEITTPEMLLFQSSQFEHRIEPGSSELCLERLLATTPDELPEFGHLHRSKGFLRHFHGFWWETHQHYFDVQHFIRAHDPKDQDRARALMDIYVNFETAYKENFGHHKRSYFDQARREQFVYLKAALKKTSVFFLGFSRFVPAEFDLYKAIITASLSSSLLLLESPDCPHMNWPELEGWLSNNKLPFQVIDCEIPDRIGSILGHTFNKVDDEMTWVCQSIAEQLLSGMPAQDIGIGLSLKDKGTLNALHRRLQQFAIPVSHSPTSSILETPFGHFLLRLVGVLTADFSPDSLLHFFSHPFSQTFTYNQSSYALRADVLEQMACDFSIVSGWGNWLSAFQQFLSQLQQAPSVDSQAEEIFSQHYDGLQGFKVLIDHLFSTSNASDFCRELEQVFAAFQMDISETSDLYLQWQDFQNSLALFSSFPYTYENAFEIVKSLTLFLSHRYCTYTNQPVPGVHLFDIHDHAFRPFSLVFLPFCTQQAFPQRLSDSFCVAPQTRRKLGWMTQSHYDAQQWQHFMGTLSSADTLVYSYSAPHTASSCLQRLSALFSLDPPQQTPLKSMYPTVECDLMSISNGSHRRYAPLHFSLSEDEGFQKTVFSPTELETYQTCPYRYYHLSVLKLQVPEAISEDVSAAVWGSMVHHILQSFFAEHPTAANMAAAKQSLLQISQQAFDAHDDGSFYWKVKREIWFGSDHLGGLIDAILDTFSASPFPLHFSELEAPFSLTIDDDITLKGRIDGVLSHDHSVSVIDYKTGSSIPNGNDLKLLRSLQLPIYMLALSQSQSQDTVIGGIIWQLRDHQKQGLHVLASRDWAKKDIYHLKKKRPFIWSDSYFLELKQHIKRLVASLRSGYFSSILPEGQSALKGHQKKMCRYCEFKGICYSPERFSAI